VPQGAVSDGDRRDPLQRPSNRGFIIDQTIARVVPSACGLNGR